LIRDKALGLSPWEKGSRRGSTVQKRNVRGQNLDRQAEICRKALDLFISKGYSGTSMSMISKSLGMSKANLYHYCSSKENLFYRIILDYLQRHLIPILKGLSKYPMRKPG
jgi:AcrR family transcriptional regulator